MKFTKDSKIARIQCVNMENDKLDIENNVNGEVEVYMPIELYEMKKGKLDDLQILTFEGITFANVNIEINTIEYFVNKYKLQDDIPKSVLAQYTKKNLNKSIAEQFPSKHRHLIELIIAGFTDRITELSTGIKRNVTLSKSYEIENFNVPENTVISYYEYPNIYKDLNMELDVEGLLKLLK